ncbi:MAG: LexA family transcriptional regulator [FCB group bacterium]|nr:LexA family transcriptional regulator [FCB group bacterium]
MLTLTERCRWALTYVIKTNNLTNKTLGVCLGVSEATIGNYRNEVAAPKIEFVDKFCGEFDISAEWFVRGTGAPFPGAQGRYPEVCGERKPAGGTILRKGAMPDSPDSAASGLIYIPVARMTLSDDGHPIKNDDAGSIPFRRDALQVNPKNAVMLEMIGNEMAPTFHAGDMLMVDLDQVSIRSGLIYAISLGEKLISIKRLEARGAQIRVISDNRKIYEPFLMAKSAIQVIGKVVWHGGEL